MELKQLSPYKWELPKTGKMRVPGIIYAERDMLEGKEHNEPLKQVANVATLPGIVKGSLVMPDMHWGYGFPIGGVAAFDWETGVISPGGVGYDINCGVRMATTALEKTDVLPRLEALVTQLYQQIPSGLGSTGPIKLSVKEEKQVLREGSRWAVGRGYGENRDIAHTEDAGCMTNADPDIISTRALERGRKQLGTLGSGNHFLEVGVVDKVFDLKVAQAFGLFQGQVTLLLHSGSRVFGYQVCDDYIRQMNQHVNEIGIDLPDRQLACAMIQSKQGQLYFNAMACAANYAWANRQILMHRCHEVFQHALGVSPKNLDMKLVYDVSHNIAKKETHVVAGEKRVLCVHRKGATRSFPPNHEALCKAHLSTGQPILVPGDMGTASYVLVGTETAMMETFGSTCHGAGRVLSRTAAKKRSRGRSIQRELADKGIMVRWTGRSTLAEEMPDAYKDISKVVGVVHSAGISRKVARLRPLAVVKG
ncbi:MAG: RtcB family protein [Deltaproteobacteria bacterium]|jgi:tRNA-splicing ligase RtcB|nr:RtcB family protein [Deltaproteobacteria bacterium]